MKLAVIPARGGSKRIPLKNIKSFCGKPVISYSIEQALATNLFDKVVVSTDDQDIADVAESFGAEVPFLRPAELSGDKASARAAVHHAREFFEQQGIEVSFTCCIYATAPFIQQQAICQGLELLQHSDKQYSFSVTPFEYTPFRGIVLGDNPQLLFPQHRYDRSQDLPEVYHDAGQFYWTKVKHPMKDEPLVGAPFEPVIIPRYLVQDIDNPDDWTRAEIMYRVLKEQSLI